MVQISEIPVPSQKFPVLDSYINVDFARLFSSSNSISDNKSELGAKIDNQNKTDFANKDEINLCTAVSHVLDDEEIDPLTKTTILLPLTPKPLQQDFISSSISCSALPGLQLINKAKVAVISGDGWKEKTSDYTAAPDMDYFQGVQKEVHDQLNDNTRPSTPPAVPPCHNPTTRVELRTLYEKFPDICPSVPAPPPTFFNRGSYQQNSSSYVRSPPATPRKYGAPDSRRLAESFASRTPLPGKLKIAPRMLKESLRDWYQMPGFMAKCRRDQELDPYPHLNMNEGWNRARCQGEQWHDAFSRPLQKPNNKMLDFMETQEQLMRFSWSEQVDSIVVDGGLAKGVFDRIFHGVDAEKERMAGRGQKRTPGAWWARRKRHFYDMKGRGFTEEIYIKNCQIWDGVKAWAAAGVDERQGKLKRKLDAIEEMAAKMGDLRKTRVLYPPAKKNKARRRIAQVMSEEWRSRRRAQEKKAGRWTDATPLQNQLWAEFYWVLDAKDHHDRSFFDTRDWPRIFAERGWPGVTKSLVWTEFNQGWGPLQSWLYRYTLAAKRQYKMYTQRDVQQRRQRQWASADGLPDSRYGYTGYYQ